MLGQIGYQVVDEPAIAGAVVLYGRELVPLDLIPSSHYRISSHRSNREDLRK